jgi:hypothetical protein
MVGISALLSKLAKNRLSNNAGSVKHQKCGESLEAVQQTAAVILGGIAPELAALAVAA